MNLQDGSCFAASELNETLKPPRSPTVKRCHLVPHSSTFASIKQFLGSDIIGLGAENC